MVRAVAFLLRTEELEAQTAATEQPAREQPATEQPSTEQGGEADSGAPAPRTRKKKEESEA